MYPVNNDLLPVAEKFDFLRGVAIRRDKADHDLREWLGSLKELISAGLADAEGNKGLYRVNHAGNQVAARLGRS